MRIMADKQAPVGFDAGFFEVVHFRHQGNRIEHNSIADNTNNVFMKNSGGNKILYIFFFRFSVFIRNNNRMSCVCTALISGDNIDVVAQVIDDFSFSFIAPLGAYNNLNWHGSSLYIMSG